MFQFFNNWAIFECAEGLHVVLKTFVRIRARALFQLRHNWQNNERFPCTLFVKKETLRLSYSYNHLSAGRRLDRNWWNNYRFSYTYDYTKVACIFPMVIVFILSHAKFGPNDNQEDARHLSMIIWVGKSIIVLPIHAQVPLQTDDY